MIISFDGLDSSGKATQARLLTEHLKTKNISAAMFRSPDYETASGKELKLRLQNKLGNWQSISWQEKMGYFAANRVEHKDEVISMHSTQAIVVYDRYVQSSVAFMIVEAAHGQEISDTLRSEVRGAVETLEYAENSMPKEDVSIFFDIPPKVAVDLLKGRKKEQSDEAEYTDYLSVQEALHTEYVKIAEENPEHMIRISCMEGDRLRSIDEVGQLVRLALAQKFPDRAQLFA
ncbi:MAG: hypothetical protein AAB649_02955 [Patescibacteria group bacterium]